MTWEGMPKTGNFLDGAPFAGTDDKILTQRRKVWRQQFERGNAARQERAALETDIESAEADLNVAQAELEEHPYFQLLATRDTARKRLEAARARLSERSPRPAEAETADRCSIEYPLRWDRKRAD